MMTSNIRSVSGALMMLAIIPIFAGLLACMPEHVPLGNPERARIDPEMNGIWFVHGENGLIGNLVMIQPWDKRTWIVANVFFDEGDLDILPDEEDEDFEGDMSTYERFIDLLNMDGIDEGSFELGVLTYKSWLAKVGGENFMMWEMRGIPNDEGDGITMDSVFTFDFRVRERSADRMVLQLIDADFEPLKAAEKTRRAWEKVVRKYVDDDALYEEETATFRRVRKEDEELVAELIAAAFVDF